MSDFGKMLKVGKEGEDTVFSILVNKYKVQILRTCDMPSKSFAGPRLSSEKDLVLPDGMVFGNGTYWVEVKSKEHWTYHRNSGSWQTGIDRLCYDRYLAILDKTKHPVILLFLHKNSRPWEEDVLHGCPEESYPPTGLFWVSLDTKFHHSFSDYGNGGMVYWRFKQLRPIEELFPAQNDLFR